MANADDVILAEVDKNAREVLRVTATTYEGIDLLDVRCWTRPATPTGGECKPTKKGLSLRRDIWREVLITIAAAVEEGGADAEH